MSTPKMPPAVLPFNALVGQVLQRRREHANKNQGEAALAIGLTQSAYSRIESGQTALTVSHLRAVAQFLGTTSEDIMAEAEAVAKQLVQQGVQVPNDKPADNDAAVKAALFIGLGVLLAILAKK